LRKSIQVLIFFNFSVNLHLRDVQCIFNKIVVRILAKDIKIKDITNFIHAYLQSFWNCALITRASRY